MFQRLERVHHGPSLRERRSNQSEPCSSATSSPIIPTAIANKVFIAQLAAALLGYGALSLLGAGYWAAAVAMLTTTALLPHLRLRFETRIPRYWPAKPW